MILFWLGCACPNRAELDYADTANWICHPDIPDVCDEPITLHTVEADGSITTSTVEANPDAAVDCFHVYPTVDLALKRGNADLRDLTDEERTTIHQAGLLAQECRLIVPAYRQATLGTYLTRERKAEPCFDVAYDDVESAFEHYLAELNDGRPFVLVGHSQGPTSGRGCYVSASRGRSTISSSPPTSSAGRWGPRARRFRPARPRTRLAVW